ncbi:MAG: glycosyltransferase family 2 protein, partial [Brevefilum sp.]|nr:glycosyltransferase family 2 protein [Brevefilum sp.]
GKKTHKITTAYFKTNQDLATNLDEVINSAQGDFYLHLLPGTVLREHTLYLIANEINQFPEAEVIYTDEDQLNEKGERSWPFFKPDWNPDLIFSQNLLSTVAAFKIDSLIRVGGMPSEQNKDIDLSLALHISEVIPSSRIRHIPHVGAHRLYPKSQTNSKEAHFQTIKSHFDRLGKDITLIQTDSPYWRISYPVPVPEPLVSILIPTKNQHDLVKNCLESIRQKTQYSNYEVLIINNQTEKSESSSAFEYIEKEYNARLLDYNHPFNYSAINNFAAQHANGDVFLFLNDDIEVISPDWLDEMVSHALRKEIGAVGAMLYFPNNAIQHAGIVLHPDRIAGHAFYLQARGSHGQNDRARLVQNYSAVTGACMAIERTKFHQVGGFDEENLPVAYNDVDLCLKLKLAGYRNLWTPYAELYHYESVTRGLDNTEEKLNRLKMEARYMIDKWGSYILNDPAYHLNLKSHPFFSLAEPPRAPKPWLSQDSNN